jgi:hypothetical protein
MAIVTIDGIEFETVHVPTAGTNVLLIQTPGGFLGWGVWEGKVA